MHITVNGNPIDQPFDKAANLEEVLVELVSTTVPRDHLVGSVRLNGTEFSEKYEGQAREVSRGHINDLEVATVPLTTYASAALRDCTVFIDRICLSVKDTAERFRMNDEHEANDHYSRVLESLRALYQFIDVARRTLAWDFESSLHEGRPIQEEWHTIEKLVDDLKQSQEEGDWILLADVMEYELVPALERWKNIFGEKARASAACV